MTARRPVRMVQRLLRKDDGATGVVAAMVISVALGAGALAVDIGHGYTARTLLQNAADEAAFAAVAGLPDSEVVLQRATFFAGQSLLGQDYGTVLTPGSVETGQWDGATRTFTPTDAATADAVRVTLRTDLRTAMGWIFDRGAVGVGASAVAARTGASGQACVLALNQLDAAIELNGNVTINLPDCGLASNSTASDSLTISGNSSSVTVQSIRVSGGISAHDGVIHSTEAPQTWAPPLPDPYGDLPTIFPGLVDRSCAGNCSGSLQPGRYAASVTFKGTVTLAPGLYHFAGGAAASGPTTISGSGVTLVFDGSLSLSSSNTTLSISAPATTPASIAGGLRGIALYGLGSGTSLTLRAASGSLDGAVYVPHGTVDVGGNGGLGGCSQVVAGSVVLRGTPTARQSCDSVPMTSISMGGTASLVY